MCYWTVPSRMRVLACCIILEHERKQIIRLFVTLQYSLCLAISEWLSCHAARHERSDLTGSSCGEELTLWPSPVSLSPLLIQTSSLSGRNISDGEIKTWAMTIFSAEKKRTTVWRPEIAFSGGPKVVIPVRVVLRAGPGENLLMWELDSTCVEMVIGLEGKDFKCTFQ